jgi:hypothetical protein
VQVYALGIPDKDALGLLGYVFQFQGTEEWLHLVFNAGYVVALIVIAWGFFLSPAARSIVPGWAMVVFLVFGVGLELWHVNEHIVIISNVIANDGCPCPGILDERLGISDTVLHYGYNMVAYVATLVPFLFLVRERRASHHRGSSGADVGHPYSKGAPSAADRTGGPVARRCRDGRVRRKMASFRGAGRHKR